MIVKCESGGEEVREKKSTGIERRETVIRTYYMKYIYFQ